MIEISDVMELAGVYAGLAATAFCAAYGPIALWNLFKSLAAPDVKND